MLREHNTSIRAAIDQIQYAAALPQRHRLSALRGAAEVPCGAEKVAKVASGGADAGIVRDGIFSSH
jgi:hypothetical protein